MSDLYVVLGDSDIVYYNENRESSGDEVMNYDCTKCLYSRPKGE